MRHIKWPENKDFAFTVIDDTDDAFLDNIKPIYNYLIKKSIITTKSVWVYPTRDDVKGDSLLDQKYFEFVKCLKEKGFEIILHNVGSGFFNREEIIEGLKIFKQLFGYIPTMQVNHSRNPDNIYWGINRYSFIFKKFFKFLRLENFSFYGDDPDSNHFWGDYSKKHIQYFRNRDYHGINTLFFDPLMPFIEKSKEKFSNYWFSCSIGNNLKTFNSLLSKKNIDKLKEQKGCCIVYTHFGEDFVDNNNNLNPEFIETIDYLSKQNGWFVPAGDILNFLKNNKSSDYVSGFYLFYLDLIWLIQRIWIKVKKRIESLSS
jgi:hypothetical protein